MNDSWEELTLPALKIAIAKGSTSLHDLIAAFKSLRGERDPDPNSELGRMVGSAFAALLHAELLIPTSKDRYQPSAASLALMNDPPDRIDKTYLRTIPCYVQFWDKARRDMQARDFQERRFEYYSSGRQLFFLGALHPALLLLAYSIEYHLKTALSIIDGTLSKSERKLLYKHDLIGLYQLATSKGHFASCRISEDFLRYAEGMFGLRYPSGRNRFLSSGGWRLTNSVIHTYDDCIMQLDEALCADLDDPTLTMGIVPTRTRLQHTSALASAFFHCNPFALRRLEHFVSAARVPGVQLDCSLPTSPEDGFRSPHLPSPGYGLERYNRLLGLDLAGLFRFPKPSEPDPDPAAVLLRGSTSYYSHSTDIIVTRLREEFGEHNVATKRNARTRELEAFVFCRRAKRWWRSLLLETGTGPTWFGSPSEADRLERWIEETWRQFKESE